MWTGLSFAIMCLATLQKHLGLESDGAVQSLPDGVDVGYIVQTYLTRVSQCPAPGNYKAPRRCVLETLLLYVHIEQLQCEYTQTGLWILLGNIN